MTEWVRDELSAEEEIRTLADAIRKVLPDRRERIATAALQGLLADGHAELGAEVAAVEAVEYADALIAELDKDDQG